MPVRAAERLRSAFASALAAAMAVVVAAMIAAPTAAAQAITFSPAVQFESRLDALTGPPAGAELGVGANIAAGYYARIGLDAAAGPAWRDGSAVAAGRVDLVSRFLLDPFKEFRFGPYIGGGVTALWENGAGWRGRLLVLLGVEGPAHAGWRTSVEVGLGGGARLGIVLRRARANGR
jgi:hypothetical protein